MLSERTICIIHELINEKNETLVISIHCETSFDGGFYVELRKSLNDDTGILYQFCEGPLISDGSFHKRSVDYIFALRNHRHRFSGYDEAMEYFNYRPYLKTTQLERVDYMEIMTLLKNSPLPDAIGEIVGIDGHNVVFQSYIDCMSKYSYWVYPPKGYDYLRVITNIISKYLAEPYDGWAHVECSMTD